MKKAIEKYQNKFQKSYELTVKEIKRRNPNNTAHRRLLIKTAEKLTQIEFLVSNNRMIDTKGMIKEDIRSRKLREIPYEKQTDYDNLMSELDKLLVVNNFKEKVYIPKRKCTCDLLCFCIDKNGKYLR